MSATRERMSALAESFHVLEGRPGVRPWDAAVFYASLKAGGWTSGASRQAGLFVLTVWNSTHDWQLPLYTWKGDKQVKAGEERWNSVLAIGGWDDRNRAAYRAWCAAPWFP